ncbi:hypothetical protein [Rhodococcus sp. MTM3W5.2]|uniref:hypothetical protein n=1 Tax=Rhodococcus sp. MTM3W5.2 TaxID=1805827 RepID=UPI00097BF3D4|nr:hypothetical protein [Rhodococcus sp. MTM3W5.2]
MLHRVRLQELQDQHESEIGEIRAQTRESFEWWEKSFGVKTRDWRKARGWSQDDLAQRLNELGFEMHQTTVAKSNAVRARCEWPKL